MKNALSTGGSSEIRTPDQRIKSPIYIPILSKFYDFCRRIVGPEPAKYIKGLGERRRNILKLR